MRDGVWEFGGNVKLAGAATEAPPAQSAATADAPGTGEVRRTALQDDFNGIRFEIARMVKYVQEARSDAVIIDTARLAAAHWGKMVEEAAALRGKPMSAHNSKIIQLEGIDIWCRAHFCYLNDGANVEVIQTPSRMARATRVGKDILKEILAPFYAAMEASGAGEAMRGYEPPAIFTGDCVPLSQRVITRGRTDHEYNVGEIGELRDTWESRQVVSYNEKSHKFEFKPITRFIETKNSLSRFYYLKMLLIKKPANPFRFFLLKRRSFAIVFICRK